MKFKDYLEANIFGFEDGKPVHNQQPIGDDPIDQIDAETILMELVRLKLGGKIALWDWHDTVEWGKEQPGALKVEVSPLGKTRITTRRLTHNLLGERVWVCKRVIPFKDDHKYNEIELAHNVAENLILIDRELLDTPRKEYPDFGHLVVATAQNCRQYAPEIFIYQGVRKTDDNNYLIHFEYRGQGVEAPGAARCEEFCIEISFKPETGIVRSFGYEVQSPTRGHVWIPQPSEWDEKFTPSQPIDEIMQQIVASLTSY